MKLNHLIAAAALATLASGAAFAQNGGSGSAGASASNNAQSALGGAKDKAQDQKNSMQSQTRKDVKGSSNNPITVTPPSQDDPNTRVNVDTDPADANAAVGQAGVSADAKINPPQTPASKKKSDNNSDNK